MMKLSCVVVFLLCAALCTDAQTSCLKGRNGNCISLLGLFRRGNNENRYTPVSISDKFPEREYLNPSLQVEDDKPKSNKWKFFQNDDEDEDVKNTNTNPWIPRFARQVKIYSRIEQSRKPCPQGYVRYSTADECTPTFPTTSADTTTPYPLPLSTFVAIPDRDQAAVQFERTTYSSNKRFSGYEEDEK